MKKSTFTAALAKEQAPAVQEEATAKPKDDRINTTVRLPAEGLVALKNIAAERRIRVNDLVLEGIEYVLALNGRKMKLRK